jgi:cellulose biosynthesis protein BcsQ/Tfp pilus assembly protein PilF
MFTITFYSYKGGVGRTSALMNVAHRLCERGKRVCVLDFDLEAPGLDSFQGTRRDPISQGVVEYITSFLGNDAAPDLLDYAYDVTPEGDSGKIFLIPSGRRDAAYQHDLSKLDWKLLYRQKNGYLIIEALKRAVECEFQVDYLLIDSRTGLTDVSGICTFQLPDLVVLLFNLNDQNIEGTAQVYKSILNNKLNRLIQTLLVASPIPDIPESLELRARRFDLARRSIGSAPDLILPYDPFMCFQETILSDQQSRALSKGYRELTDRLISKNGKDVITLLSLAVNLREAGEMELAELKYREILDMYPKSGEAWFEFGRFARISRNVPAAVDAFRRATESITTRSKAYAELILTELQAEDSAGAKADLRPLLEFSADLAELARVAEAFCDRGDFVEALEVVDKAVSLQASGEANISVFWMRAQAFAGLKMYEQSFVEYNNLRNMFPSALSAVFNAGAMAAFANRDEASELLKRSVELFEASDKRGNPRDTANVFSAIAFAYEFLGNKSEAVICLRKALDAADKVERRTIFLFPAYQDVVVPEFIQTIQKWLSRLVTEPQLLQ